MPPCVGGDARRLTCAGISRSGWWFRSQPTRCPTKGCRCIPDVRFIPRGVGVRSLTPTGYDSACEAILAAAESLAAQGVDAIMVIGTSLTFYRGSDFHDQLMERLRDCDRAAGEHHEPGGGRWLAQLRRASDRGRHRLCRRRQRAAGGLSHRARVRGDGAGGLRPVRLRRAWQQERGRYHRSWLEGVRARRRALKAC